MTDVIHAYWEKSNAINDDVTVILNTTQKYVLGTIYHSWLVVIELNPSDSGFYRCVVQSYRGEYRSNWSELNVTGGKGIHFSNMVVTLMGIGFDCVPLFADIF